MRYQADFMVVFHNCLTLAWLTGSGQYRLAQSNKDYQCCQGAAPAVPRPKQKQSLPLAPHKNPKPFKSRSCFNFFFFLVLWLTLRAVLKCKEPYLCSVVFLPKQLQPPLALEEGEFAAGCLHAAMHCLGLTF